jgi:gliding motility-associated-like protein
LNLGADKIRCYGDTFFAFLPSQAGTKYWVNGTKLDDPFYPITQTGVYAFEVNNACGSVFDTIRVDFYPPPVANVPDQRFCRGSSITLDASQPHAISYLWSNGDTSSSISVNQSGRYWVQISSRCRTITDSIDIIADDPIPSFNLGNDTIFCEGNLILSPGLIPGADYSWSNGSRSSSILVTSSGRYWLEMSNSCNTRSDTINVLITGPPQAVLGTEVRYCATNIFNLNAQNPGSRYLWSTGDTTQSIVIQQAGKYWVRITNDCGQVSDTVEVIPEFPLLQLQLGNDTSICAGDTLLIDPLTRGADLTWQNGQTDSVLYVWESGTYTLRADNLCGTFIDSIKVRVLEVPNFDLPDTAICEEGGSLWVEGPPGMQSYQWSNGEIGRSLRLQQGGNFSLTVNNGCFSYIDTFTVVEETELDFKLPGDTAICEGESLVIDLRHIGYPIFWDDGTISALRTLRQGGRYRVLATNTCGTFSHYFNLKVNEEYRDTSLLLEPCLNDSLLVEAPNDLQRSFWLDDSLAPASRRWLSDSGEYQLYIENACGSALFTYQVEPFDCDCPAFLANAFTPNADGLNDRYLAFLSCEPHQFQMRVFDRWGKVVYISNSIDEGWSGEDAQGRKLNGGTYLVMLNYSWWVKGSLQQKQVLGELNLIR